MSAAILRSDTPCVGDAKTSVYIALFSCANMILSSSSTGGINKMSHRWVRKSFLLLAGIIFFSLAEAQSDFRPGYIVTLEGDTLQGLINLRGDKLNAKDCIFKQEDNSEKVTYTPDQIRAYGIQNLKRFVSPSSLAYDLRKSVFLEYVAEGPLTIFFYKDDENVEHFLASKDTVIMELSYQLNSSQDGQLRSRFEKYKGQLRYLLGDEPTLFPLIDKIACNKKDLRRLAEEYKKLRHPVNESFVSYQKKNIKFKFAIHASVGTSHLTSPPYNMYLSDYLVTKSLDFDRTYTYEIGAAVNVYLDHAGRNRLSLQLSPALNFVEYNSKVERRLPPLLYTYQSDIKYTTLKVPVLVKYAFNSSNHSISPFVKGGPGIAVYMSQRGQYVYYSTPLSSPSSQPVIFNQSLDSNEKSAKGYLVAGAGIDLKLSRNLLSVSALYSYGAGQLEGYRTDVQLQVEYQF